MVMLVRTKFWLRTYSWLNAFQIINRQPGNDLRYLRRLSRDKPRKIFAVRLGKKRSSLDSSISQKDFDERESLAAGSIKPGIRHVERSRSE